MAPTSLSLFPDVSAALHSVPTLSEMQSQFGVETARSMVLEVFIDQAESEKQAQDMELQLDSTSPAEIPMRSALTTNMPFETVEQRILNGDVPNIKSAAEAN